MDRRSVGFLLRTSLSKGFLGDVVVRPPKEFYDGVLLTADEGSLGRRERNILKDEVERFQYEFLAADRRNGDGRCSGAGGRCEAWKAGGDCTVPPKSYESASPVLEAALTVTTASVRTVLYWMSA